MEFLLVGAASPTEADYLVRQLEEKGYVTQLVEGAFELRPLGWDKLESSATQGGIPGKCFVAMWFHESLEDVYDKGIYPAVKLDCKMDPIRIDLIPYNDNIVDKIISEIQSCQFMVADFTGTGVVSTSRQDLQKA
jgi:hypothetical protein